MLFVGIAILIVLVISSTMIEKSLTSIGKQNELIIELLKEKSDKS
ncbi:hypothetical protein WAX46_15485 [Bacillus sp. FJAT-53060]|nr:hypothetical protein [Bacillus stratosphericus]